MDIRNPYHFQIQKFFLDYIIMSNYSQRFDQVVVNTMSNKYVSGFITLFCVLYISLARPNLPAFIQSLFEYKVFKFLMLVLTAYLTTMNLTVALIVAIAFVVTLNLLNEQKMAESFISDVTKNTIERFNSDQAVDDDKEIASLTTDSNSTDSNDSTN